MQLIVLALCVASVFAAPSGYEHGHYAAVPVSYNQVIGSVSKTPIYNVQKVHHTVHPVVTPIHHPPVTSVHHEPTAVLAKAPKISGYAYTSEVRHDAPVKAVAHAAPVAVAHGGDLGYGGAVGAVGAIGGYAGGAVATAVGGYADGGYGHGAVVGHGPAVHVGHEPAPYVSGTSLAVAPAVIKETPAVSSYALNTGRIDTVSQSHYGTVHTPVVSKVGYQAHAVPVAVGHTGYGGHGY